MRSEEVRKRISETCKLRGVGKWRLGKKLSDATKEKMRKRMILQWQDNGFRKKVVARQKEVGTGKWMKEKTGSSAVHWGGDDTGYTSKHAWIRKTRCRAYECENCGLTSEERQRKDGRNYIQWANVSGEHRRTSADYIALCTKCHAWFDSILKTRLCSR